MVVYIRPYNLSTCWEVTSRWGCGNARYARSDASWFESVECFVSVYFIVRFSCSR